MFAVAALLVCVTVVMLQPQVADPATRSGDQVTPVVPTPPQVVTPPVVVVTPPASGTPARVIASFESRLLTPQEFATNADNLAAAVADLNRAQLQFIQNAKTSLAQENPGRLPGLAFPMLADPKTDRVDADLREIAARAIKAGRLADDLARTMAAQDNGSDAAAKMAEPYSAVRRMAYALVIEAQNLRDELARGTLKRADAVSRIAEYGARLWNARASGLDSNVKAAAGAINPFVAEMTNAGGIAPVRYLSASAALQFKSQLGSKSPRLWLAVAQDQVTRTISIPAPIKPVGNVFDPALLDKLANPAEQVDADRARQAAAAQLDPGNPAGARQIQIAFKAAAVVDKDAIAAAVIPSFDRGTGTTMSLQKGASGGDDFIADLSALTGIDLPALDDSQPIRQAERLVNLTISNVSFYIARLLALGDADVDLTFRVEWKIRSMPSGEPLEIRCNTFYHIFPPVQAKVSSGRKDHNAKLLNEPYPGEITWTCSSWQGDPRFDAYVTTTVRIGEEGEPTVTPTPTSTPTLTPTRVATPAPTRAATGTRTSTRAATAIPTTSPAFTMNGTFSIKWARGYYTSGSIKVTVDLKTGTASAFMNGAGTYASEDDSCPPGAKDHTARRTFEGTLKGTVNPQSGELKLTGQLPGQVSTTGGCRSDTLGLPANLSLSGTLDLKNHTAKGNVLSTGAFDAGEGDWHAGK